MEYAKREGADWRSDLQSWIQSRLGHAVFNPNVESKKFLRKHFPNGDFRRLKTRDIDRFTGLVRKIVALDSSQIVKRTDYVVCYWDRSAQRGAGTKGELTLAKYFGKPVYMVTKIRHDRIPGWVLGCTTRIFASFAELKQFLDKSTL
jgi:hypothetical protein